MTDLIVFLVLLAMGYGFGRYAELQHYKSIIKREKIFNSLPAIAIKTPPLVNEPSDSRLVTGSVVISVDYFKRFISVLRNLVGGRITSYETLLDRARREAILRMKAQAKEMHAKYVFNIKLETASIYKGRRQQIGSVEVLAYGTAIIPTARGEQ
jgi:uncharacterized protein YbjQ (UPF0145 family)